MDGENDDSDDELCVKMESYREVCSVEVSVAIKFSDISLISWHAYSRRVTVSAISTTLM